MARKDVFANITAPQAAASERRATPGYATRGASRSMINSLHELAEKAALADQSPAVDTVLELDTALVENSFVSDRLGDDDAAYSELLEAIKERGQDTPILVRPHPEHSDHYQIVFGHRRMRAAKELGRPVRAIVRDVSDADHVIAQGQENSARENLSFIERAIFAQKLLDLGHEKRTIQAALSIDAPMLTRMLSVTGRVPRRIIDAIGAAKGIGRDRWIDLAQQIEKPSIAALAEAHVTGRVFAALASDARFESLAGVIKKAGRLPKRQSSGTGWQAGDASVRAEFKSAGKSFSIALKANDAARFGRFIADNLDRLHAEFLTSTKTKGQ